MIWNRCLTRLASLASFGAAIVVIPTIISNDNDDDDGDDDFNEDEEGDDENVYPPKVLRGQFVHDDDDATQGTYLRPPQIIETFKRQITERL